MTEAEIKNYITKHKNCFDSSDLSAVEGLLSRANVTAYELENFKIKSPQTALVLSIFLGFFGIDRFYIGDYTKGIIKLIVNCCCCIWWIIDIFSIVKTTKSNNYHNLHSFLFDFENNNHVRY